MRRAKACPVVAHVRGVVHLARGEGEEGYTCIANGTKGAGVAIVAIGATVATGGMAAGPACALVGGAAAGSQVALDGVDTGIRSAKQRKFVPAGTWAGAKLAVDTGDAVHIVDAVLAPVQTAALAAGGAAVARGVASYKATAAVAVEQDLAGVPQSSAPSSQAPVVRPNPTLNAANLDALPPRPANHPSALPPRAAPQPPAAPQAPAAPSVAPSQGAASAAPSFFSADSMGSVLTAISEVSEAYSAGAQARIVADAAVEFPMKSTQHAWKHRHQLPLGPNAPQNWSNATMSWFRTWLRNQLDASAMYDLTYRGVVNHRMFYNQANGVGLVFKVVQQGAGMDFVACFPLSPQQIAHVLSHGGKMN